MSSVLESFFKLFFLWFHRYQSHPLQRVTRYTHSLYTIVSIAYHVAKPRPHVLHVPCAVHVPNQLPLIHPGYPRRRAGAADRADYYE